MNSPATTVITFLPDGRSADVECGTSVVDASIRAGVRLIAPCNGKGTCGKCGVKFHEGAPAPVPADQHFFSGPELEEGWRLACMHVVQERCVVFASPATLGKVDFGPTMEGLELLPNVRKVWVRLDTVRGDLVTWGDIVAAARTPIPQRPGLGVLRRLSALVYEPGMELTVVVRGDSAVQLEDGDTRLENYGLALDIGTTTVAGSLLDLNTGEELSRDSSLNRQSVHGADVMSRLTSLSDDPGLLPVLQQLAVETVHEILGRLLSDAGARRERIYEVAVVGNSCMHHIFLGLNPLSLASSPYDALVLDALTVQAGDLGLDLPPETTVYALPNIGSFVGSDALGATLAVGLHRSEAIKCLADIGTNGEIVLGSRDRVIACSTPAGPAFEGATISCGMIASEGAICKVRIEGTVHVETIGGIRPKGIAGSGLIDACSELYRAGLLTRRAKYVVPGPNQPGEGLAGRFRPGSDGMVFLLAKSYGKEILLTQRDVRELQLAKGVICAAIEALKQVMGLSNDDISELHLAGTFGSYLDIGSARTIGLVPPLDPGRIRAVGNAAIVGAKRCLLSLAARAEAEDLARRIEHVELPTQAAFQDMFMDAMLFPPLEEDDTHG